MALSWNEIKDRALKFSKEWAGTHNEEADAKPFLVEFFNVFGVDRKRVASFEHRVKKLNEQDGYIDLVWKGMLLVEMKSLGKNLDKAYQQARDYLHGLKPYELPKFILISDFNTFRLYDLEEDTKVEFKLVDLVMNVRHFSFILGIQKQVYKEQDPVNIDAAMLMGKLHDKLKAIGYEGHPLEVYLVRLLFCLFAEDTTIFEPNLFRDFIVQRTNEDGSDLAARLSELFFVLNTPKDKRYKNIDEQLNEFPYVNGKLFEEVLPPASFDSEMRSILLGACSLNWGKISPAIFGSMFQSVMNPKERRNLGAHYTSEKNILKVIKPLFLDDLWKEFDSLKGNKNKLADFHKKLSTMKFLDPACGCGNFLVITYRELRLLEMEILRTQYKNQRAISIESIIWLDVDMMYGIEYDEFPARIAEVAMWLIDHQMNMAISNEFGEYFVRLPLKKAATIVHGNSLRINWETIISKNELSFILGNPPFYGYSLQSKEQKEDMKLIFADIEGSGILDYVTGWYKKAADYIKETKIRVGFVSTNSIVQGEQTSVLWQSLINQNGIKIHFAHRTFKWSNEAKGNAGVYCIIIGFANFDISNKTIFDYEDIKGEPHQFLVKNINPYLVDAKNIFIGRRAKPLCRVPDMIKGSSATDGGNLLLDHQQKVELLESYPIANKLIKPFIGSQEFLHNEERWCLWLKDANPLDFKLIPPIIDRIQKVKAFRSKSTKMATQKWADFPTLFVEERQPKSNYILIPRHSSENRNYIPLGFMDSNIIVSDSAIALPNATLYHFGVLMSTMHMSWVKTVCGRLESRFRYSNTIVYNNYPWPENTSEKQIKAIEFAAQKVLDVRALFTTTPLADLYEPLTMPPALVKAHNDLNKAVDLSYRSQPFTTEANRMVFLFELYEKYTADLFTKGKKK